MTHNELILAALKKGERLTPLTILRRFGCLRASARIYDLRRAGHPVETLRTPSAPYATYRLARKKRAA